MILVILFVVREIRNIRGFSSAVKECFNVPGRRGTVVLAGILVGLVLNIQLYGGNYVKYGTINPGVEVVLPLEKAMQYRLTARNHIFKLFKHGQITIEQAREMASQITHPGDREDAISMVENYAYLQQAGFKPLGPLPYTAMWILQMLSTSFGIKAHIGMPNHGFSFIPLTILILFVLTAYVVRWRPWDYELASHKPYWGIGLLCRISYCSKSIIRITLIQRILFFPWRAAISFRSWDRCMPFRVCTSCVSSREKRDGWRLPLLRFWSWYHSDFPFFLSKVTPEWYDWTLK